MADFSWSETSWLDLLNSDWRDYRGSGRTEDRLENPLWLEGFISRWKLDLASVPRATIVGSLRGLRRALARLAGRFLKKEQIKGRHWREINIFLERAPFRKRVSLAADRASLEPVFRCGKMDAVLGRIALSFAETAVRADSASRIKSCANEDCRWTFLDHSKNSSRRWCENTCGNLMKVRRFRDRRRSGR